MDNIQTTIIRLPGHGMTIPCRLERNEVEPKDLLKLDLGLETRLRQFEEVPRCAALTRDDNTLN